MQIDCHGFLELSGSVAHELSVFFALFGKRCRATPCVDFPNKAARLADGSGGLFQILDNRPPFGVVVGQLARTMEHCQIAIGIAMHTHTGFDVMAASRSAGICKINF